MISSTNEQEQEQTNSSQIGQVDLTELIAELRFS